MDIKKLALKALIVLVSIVIIIALLKKIISLGISDGDKNPPMKKANRVSSDILSVDDGKIKIGEDGQPILNPKPVNGVWKGWNSTVILISIDGFRSEYLNRSEVPTLKRLAHQLGVAAVEMHPVFPAITFPNHFSIVTGVYPNVHGIVNNEFYDPDLKKTFNYKDPSNKESKWWKYEPVSQFYGRLYIVYVPAGDTFHRFNLAI